MLTGARCARYPFCTFVHRRGRRRHGFCCNGCRGLERFHTRNCSGAFREVVQDDDGVVPPLLEVFVPTLQRTRIRDEIFMLPSHWCRGDGGVLSYLDWYTSRYNLSMEAGAREAWCALAVALSMRMRRGGVRLFAFRDDCVSSEFAGYSRSVSCLCARSQDCEDDEVTGLDFAVQAALVTQTLTAEILRRAFHHIEDYHCSMFAFSCRGATHRSVACCVLFAAIVYQDAELVFTTRRTRGAARQMGLFSWEDTSDDDV